MQLGGWGTEGDFGSEMFYALMSTPSCVFVFSGAVTNYLFCAEIGRILGSMIWRGVLNRRLRCGLIFFRKDRIERKKTGYNDWIVVYFSEWVGKV